MTAFTPLCTTILNRRIIYHCLFTLVLDMTYWKKDKDRDKKALSAAVSGNKMYSVELN
jgi:hypothetical protein